MTIAMADKLVALRRAKGLSQQEVAEKLGVTRQAVSRWEQGETSPDTDNLIALLELYGTTLQELTAPGPGRPAMHDDAYTPALRFGRLDEDTPDAETREQLLATRREREKGDLDRGCLIVNTLLITELIVMILGLFVTLFQGIIGFLLDLVVLVCVWRGKPWARYLWAACIIIWDVIILVALQEILRDLTPAGIALVIGLLVFRTAEAVLLLISPSVKAYLYWKSTV